jgi:hypothetical protein
MATIDIPDEIILPAPKTEEEAKLYQALNDYFTKIRQTFIEIESKLP